jgi:hypothetical protein
VPTGWHGAGTFASQGTIVGALARTSEDSNDVASTAWYDLGDEGFEPPTISV